MTKNYNSTNKLLAMMALMDGGIPLPTPTIKEEKKCLLPDCQILTKHNGGYCCADHCRAHRLLIKKDGNK